MFFSSPLDEDMVSRVEQDEDEERIAERAIEANGGILQKVFPVWSQAARDRIAERGSLSPDVLLVHTWNSEPLPREHGGPVRMITPRLYAWKGAKWIRKIEFLTKEQLGFWEVRGYSNRALPWANDRFSG